MRRYLNTLSMKSRITFAFVGLILLPFGTIGLYSYNQSQEYMRAQAISNSQTAAKQIKYTIENKLDLIESVSNSITFNYRLQLFLGEPYDVTGDSLDNYFNFASPLVNYAMLFQKVNIQKISIYMTNTSIPEGFSAFYYESRLRKAPWYNSFHSSADKSRWVLRYDETSGDALYSYVQKITSLEGMALGAVVVDVYVNDLLEPANAIDDKQSLRIETADRQLLLSRGYTVEIRNWPLFGSAEWPNEVKHIRHGQHLFFAEILKGIQLPLVLATTMPQVNLSLQVLTNWAFIATLLILLFAFYYVLKMMLSKMKKSIGQMDHAIQSGFVPIPIERQDELGVISEKFNVLLAKITGLTGEMIRKETMHKDAQLMALQAQINPHFIYNTLDIFSARMELAGEYEVSEAMADFGKMMRYNMDSQSKFTTLEAELQHLEQYVSLQRLKYGDRLLVRIDIPGMLLSVKVIKFILQPIVENSIKHGFRHRDALSIKVAASLHEGKQLKVIVRDNGTGVAAEKLALLNERFRAFDCAPVEGNDRESIGLVNINDRLKLYYGEGYPIQMRSIPGQYAETEIAIPLHAKL